MVWNKLTTEEYSNRLLAASGGKFVLSSEYNTMKDPVTFYCKDCGTEHTRMADNAIRRPQCSVCDERRGKHKKKTKIELIRAFCKKNDGHEYSVIGFPEVNTDIDSKQKIIVIHKVCGFEKTMNPYDLPKYKCPQCKRKMWEEENLKQFKEEVDSLTEGEYEVIGNRYVNNAKKILMRHKICEKEFEMSKNHFISLRQRCPFCNNSKGERMVADTLDKFNVKYIYGKKNNECINPLSGKTLEMDFQLIDSEEKVIALIEYDGKQHFSFKEFFGSPNAEEEWKKVVYRDRVRDRFAKDAEIPLLRIPYTYQWRRHFYRI